MRQNVRYVAEHGEANAIVPHDPAAVLVRRYGDCKDRAYLIAALADSLGLDVDMVLLGVNPKPELLGTHAGLYDHVICVWNDGEEAVYFDPTHRYVPFGNVPGSDVEQRVLVLDEDRPRQAMIPAPNDAASLTLHVRADVARPAHATASITLRNDYFAEALQAHHERTGVELENYLSALVNGALYKISLNYFALDTLQEHSITFTAEADLSTFLIASQTRQYVPQTPFHVADADALERENDPYPLHLPAPYRLAMTLDLASTGYAARLDSLTLGRPGTARFTATMDTSQTGRVRFDYDFRQSRRRLTGTAKHDFLTLCRTYLESKRNMFILER